MHELVHAAALIRQENDRVRAVRHTGDVISKTWTRQARPSIYYPPRRMEGHVCHDQFLSFEIPSGNTRISEFAGNRGAGKSSRKNITCYWISDAAAVYILLFAAIVFLCCSLMYQNGFLVDANYASPCIKVGDFKRAGMFVDSFLCGKFSVKDYYNPEKAESLMKSAPGLLSSFNGIPASRIVACGNDDSNNLILKAICRKGSEAAIIYLTQSGNKFYVSGIEIDKAYAMNNANTR
ncbi:MAG TPA: hypothetical protein DET40_15385 [Lentisphaeria bacterium]|nr:MAG: hypothetical protein A2X45_05355 [Lentisphaerae bacterium GWF2_50_93]HCE44922.1 hypothetical protein [Lentisphaeria bacterium]